MSIYTGRAFSSVEDQNDLMKAHVTRAAPMVLKSDGERTLRLAVPAGWSAKSGCIPERGLPKDERDRFLARFDETVGLNPGDAARRCAATGCPVVAECLAAALEEEGDVGAGHRYGIRGGMSPKERAEHAAQLRPCGRGHTGQRVWQEVKNGRSYWRCTACTAEDAAARYGDPADRPALNIYQRQLRAQKRVCCLLCQTEMHSVSLADHIERKHGDEEMAA